MARPGFFQEVTALIIKWLVISLSLFAADYLVKGISIDDFWSGLAAAAALGIINAILRPIILVLTLPINILTLGLFTFIINALMLLLVGHIIDGVHINGFWSAFWGALVISIVSWLIHFVFDPKMKITLRRG